jgi:HlyD family secretion protein
MKKLLVLPLLWILLATGATGGDGGGNGPAKAAFRAEAVKRGPVTGSFKTTGTLEPEDVVDVGAQVAGQIKSFGTDPGDKTKTIDYRTRVEAGTVLAQIDPAPYEARVEKAKAGLARARAELRLAEVHLSQAERDARRSERLRDQRAIGMEEFEIVQTKFDLAKANVEVSKSAVQQAEATLKEAQIDLGYTTIRSPIAGVIIDRRVTVGQTVQSSFNTPSLFLIALDLKHMKVWASVNEADISHVHEGQDVRFTVDARPGETFTGKVHLIRLNAAMTQNVVTYTVEVATDNTAGKLLPYMTAEAEFTVAPRKNALLVPNAALRWRPRQAEQVVPDALAQFRLLARGGEDKKTTGRGTVWVEDKGRVRPVLLRLGVSDGTVTEVLEGDLPEGTKVVVGEE